MAPSAIIELRIEEDRFAIEMSDEDGINLATVDRLQDRDHGLGRIEAAHVDMDGITRTPYPAFFLRLSAGHDNPHLCPHLINQYHNT